VIIVLHGAMRIVHFLGEVLVGDNLLYGGRKIAEILACLDMRGICGTQDQIIFFLHHRLHVYFIAGH